MYTTIIVDESQPGSYFDLVRGALDRSTDKRQVEFSPGMFAEHSPDGLAIKFSTRVLRKPKAFEGVRIVRVIIQHSFLDGTMNTHANKKVIRRRAWATVSDSGGPKCAYLTVWGNNLGSTNQLYQDILDGTVTWQ